MDKLKNIKLFNDLNKVSEKYSSLPNLTEENEALSSRISNFDADYSAIEARLNNLLGVTE